jgi:hypothetical protein
LALSVLTGACRARTPCFELLDEILLVAATVGFGDHLISRERRRRREQEMSLGCGHYAVHAREAWYFLDYPWAIEVEYYERAVAKVSDV